MEKGILYGVGVGPGDPELMTLKAVNIARLADVIAVPHKEPAKCTALNIAVKAVPELREKPILPVDMPMTKDKAKLEQAFAAGAQTLTEALEEGKTVCFLTLGDPTVYSTYLYLHKRVAGAGYRAEIAPGGPSFCAALAALRERGAQAAMAENCGMENQRLYPTLEQIPEDAGYFSLLIVK